MLDGMLQVILNPLTFFRKLADDDRLVARAFGVVVIVVLLTGIFGYFSALPTAEAFGNTAFGAFSLIITPVTLLGTSFLSWLIYGLLVRMGAGINAKPWAITAYSMSPQVIIYAVLIILAVLLPVKLTPVTADFTDPQAFQEATLEVQREFQASAFSRASQILGLISSIWWVALIYLGVRELSDSRRALVSALLVGILTLLMIAGPYLLSPVA